MEGPEMEGQQQGQGDGDQMTELVSNLSDGMSMFAQIAASAGLDTSKLEAAQQAYQSAVEDVLSSGGKGMSQPQAGSAGIASPEAGGASGAVPASPAGVRRG